MSKSSKQSTNSPSTVGTTSFTVEFQGAATKVRALVSSTLSEEILFSHQILKALEVLPQDFPNRIPNASIKSSKISNELSTFIASTKSLQPKQRIEKAIKKYSRVFETDGPLKTMKGGPMKIHLKPGPIKPLHIYNARKTPYAYVNAAKDKLDEDEALGVIEKVHEVSDWCSPMSFVPKPNGKIRSVIDLVKLNEYVQRPTHPFPAPKDVMATIPADAKCFAILMPCTAIGSWNSRRNPDHSQLSSQSLAVIVTREHLWVSHHPETNFVTDLTKPYQE